VLRESGDSGETNRERITCVRSEDMNTQLAILDYEGTIVDEEEAILQEYPRALVRRMTKEQAKAFREKMKHMTPGDRVVLTIHGKRLEMAASDIWTLIGGYAQGCGLDPGLIYEAFQKTQRRIQPQIRSRAGIRTTLRLLNQLGWKVIVVSNAPEPTMVRKLRALRLDGFISDCQGDAGKPGLQSYRRVKDEYGLTRKDTVVVVGDNVLFDLVPAKKVFDECITVYVKTRYGVVPRELRKSVDQVGLKALRELASFKNNRKGMVS